MLDSRLIKKFGKLIDFNFGGWQNTRIRAGPTPSNKQNNPGNHIS